MCERTLHLCTQQRCSTPGFTVAFECKLGTSGASSSDVVSVSRVSRTLAVQNTGSPEHCWAEVTPSLMHLTSAK